MQIGARVGQYKFVLGPVNTNKGPGPVNTNWGVVLLNANFGPRPVNTNWRPGPVNTNWGPGLGAKQRAWGREIQTPKNQRLSKEISTSLEFF